MILLDTNVVSETMRPFPHAQVMAWLAEHEADCVMSAFVFAEVCFGIEKTRPAERSHRLSLALADLTVRFADRTFAFDTECAFLFGKIMGAAVRTGQTRQVADGIIAATALRHGTSVATRNVRDFEALGVKVVNPWI